MTQTVKPHPPYPAQSAGEGGEAAALRRARWGSIKDLFALEPGTIHVNTGTVGVMPHAVLDVLDRVTREWSGGLFDIYAPTLFPQYRAAIAEAYGVDG